MQKRGVYSYNKKGQVTIFIIIALLIIGAAALIYFLSPKVSTGTGFDATNPQGFIQSCLKKPIQKTVENLSSQGGSLNPNFYFLYKGNNIEYLCYTAENYATCVIQQPMLKQHIESEIINKIPGDVNSCFSSLQENYKNGGYTVSLNPGKTTVGLLPKRVVTRLDNYTLTVTKGETKIYGSFSVILDNNLYELISIANSILEWEVKYGDAETTLYMSYYKDLKVEKITQQDGTKIYILTDRNTGNKFQFASRSKALPPGFGVQGVANT